jgi:DNA invertase Pin-like site-specific DNA recombinase
LRAIGYVRVSTDEQAQHGVSLAAQEQKVRAYCELHNIELVRVESDAGESGSNLDRPALTRALAALDAREADGLVVAKLDRLTRSLRDWTALITGYFGPGATAGKGLWSVADSIDTTTAGGRMVINILLTIAQWEREQIAERTAAGLGWLRKQGLRAGTVPRGMQLAEDGKTLVPDERDVCDLARIKELYDGGMSARQIAREVQRPDRPWNKTTILRSMRRIRDRLEEQQP